VLSFDVTVVDVDSGVGSVVINVDGIVDVVVVDMVSVSDVMCNITVLYHGSYPYIFRKTRFLF